MCVAPVIRGRLSATRTLPFSVMETTFSRNGGLAAYRQMRSLAAASWAGTMVFASTEKAFRSRRRLSSKPRPRAGVDAPSSWTAMKPVSLWLVRNWTRTQGISHAQSQAQTAKRLRVTVPWSTPRSAGRAPPTERGASCHVRSSHEGRSWGELRSLVGRWVATDEDGGPPIGFSVP